MTDKTYLFEYRFDGAVYGLQIAAQNVEQARRKLGMMQSPPHHSCTPPFGPQHLLAPARGPCRPCRPSVPAHRP